MTQWSHLHGVRGALLTQRDLKEAAPHGKLFTLNRSAWVQRDVANEILLSAAERSSGRPDFDAGYFISLRWTEIASRFASVTSVTNRE